MDSFEFNKIAGAILACALGVMALSIVSEVIFHPAEAEQPAYVVAGVDPTGDEHGGSGGEPATDTPPIAVRLATADVAAGERSLAKCKACHTFDEGDARRTPGPNLYGIVGAPVAHLDGFSYSTAMKEKHDEGQTWTFEYLDEYLTAPRAVIPGTAMTFAGLKRDDERTNVIAYLRTLAASPVPLPEVPTAAAPEAESPPAAGAPEAEAAPVPEAEAAPAPEVEAAPEPQDAPEPAAPPADEAQPAEPPAE
jgi:cytochrome c